jgi:hypothetical protein
MNLPVSGLDVGAPAQGVAAGQMGALQMQLGQRAAYMQQQAELQKAQIAAQGQVGAAQMNATGRVMVGQGNNQTSLANAGTQQQTALMGQQNQAQIAQQQQAIQAQRNAIMQQQANQTGGLQGQQGQAAIMQAQAAQQKAQAQTAQQQLAARSQLNTQQLDQRGAAGSALLMGLNQYQGNPQAQQAFLAKTIPVLVQQGSISQDEATQLLKSDPDTAHALIAQDVLLSGYGKDLKNGKSSGAGGAGNLLNPAPQSGTNPPPGNLPLGTQAENNAQNSQIESQRSLIDGSTVMQSFNPAFFTTAGNLTADAGIVAGKLGISGTSAETLAAQRDAFAGNVLQNIMDTLAQQKGVRFNKASVETLLPEMPESGAFTGDSPETAWNKVVTLYQRMDRAGTAATQLLQKGIDPNSKAGLAQIQQMLGKSGQDTGKIPYTNSQGKVMQLGYNDIQKLATHNGMSFGDTVKQIQQSNLQAQQAQQQTPGVTS